MMVRGLVRAVVLALALTVGLAVPAGAEVITLRAGDHPTFTRLVLSIPAGRTWRIGRTDTGYRVDTGNPADSFDLDQAFARIQRDRVAALGPAEPGGGLNITLACDCHVQAFQWLADEVVIDVIDGPAPPDAPFETALADRMLTGPQTPPPPTQAVAPAPQGDAGPEPLAAFALGVDDPPTPDAAALTDLMVAQPLLPVLLQPPAGVVLPSVQPRDPLVPDPGAHVGSVGVAADISQTERAIIESFGRAASQGLLDLALATDPEPPDPDPDDTDHAPAEVADDHPEPTTDAGHDAQDTLTDLQMAIGPSALDRFALTGPQSQQPGITAHTSIDQLQPLAGTTGQIPPQGGSCLDPQLLEIETWGDDRDFASQIAERLTMLTTELDDYREGAVEALARTYLFFGFGREAVQVLGLDDRSSQERRVLLALAHLVDEVPEPGSVFADQLGCATAAALWTAIARGSLAGTSENERIAATAAFRALPPMLRGHLGARLAQLFLDFGDAGAADSILQTAQANLTADRLQTDLTAADIALETEGPAAAIDALAGLAEVDMRLTPEALVQLIDLTLAEGHQVDPALLSLADSMVYEHRGEPAAAALTAVQARAQIAADGFDAAFALLADGGEPLSAEVRTSLLQEASLALTARATDPAFLDFAFDDLPVTGSAGVENAVASRLVTLGFADRAAALLQTPAVGADAGERRYLEAEIALQLDQPEAVEPLLGGLSDPRAAGLVARARAAQGTYVAASGTASDPAGTLADASGAWRAGEWSVLEQSQDALLRAASGAILTDPPTPDPAAPLAAGRALLQDATATRDLAAQLLERFAVDPATATPATP